MSVRRAEYMLDVNVLLALLVEDHVHHRLTTAWFDTPDRQWAICAFTEAGYLRSITAPRPEQVTMAEAKATLEHFTSEPGYHYLPIDANFRTLCGPLTKRLYGTKQVTDAYLLGLAVRHGLVLVTMDKGIVHLAGEEYAKHVMLLR